MSQQKTVLLSLLVVMALVVFTTQAVKALTIDDTKHMDNIIRMDKQMLDACNSIPLNTTDSLYIQSLTECDKSLVEMTAWCNYNTETGIKYRQSGICNSPLLINYIRERNLSDEVVAYNQAAAIMRGNR